MYLALKLTLVLLLLSFIKMHLFSSVTTINCIFLFSAIIWDCQKKNGWSYIKGLTVCELELGGGGGNTRKHHKSIAQKQLVLVDSGLQLHPRSTASEYDILKKIGKSTDKFSLNNTVDEVGLFSSQVELSFIKLAVMKLYVAD
ncbi:MAG: hypothetical protein EXX96DRAFT_644627 [Benjaminiella poitrasii]|nr:MAG: hypothetical protein EXX96DRAFT_644627 [Benjaminiella poitrasii]